MNESAESRPSILIVDDDDMFCEVLSDALHDRGYSVTLARTAESAVTAARDVDPEYAVVDLRIGSESGLKVVEQLHAMNEDTRIVMLTGYASIATAEEAIKVGAVHYLTKPADADEIIAALHRDEGDPDIAVSHNPLTVKRMEWEYLQKVLKECDGNISAAARKLRMHRRTLQRKLAKRPVKD